MLLAEAAGCPSHRIVFDSPVKRFSEVRACAERHPGIRFNVNSLEELARLPPLSSFSMASSSLSSSSGSSPASPASPASSSCSSLHLPFAVGLRINPLVDAGSPEHFAVSHDESKFGVPITARGDVIAAVLARPITQLHVHSGSSMSNLSTAVQAVASVVELAAECNSALRAAGSERRITAIDIGGGLVPEDLGRSSRSSGSSSSSSSNNNNNGGDSSSGGSSSKMQGYVSALREACPQLWTDFELVTEFGQWTHANGGFASSTVEYAFDRGSTRVAYVHLGADFLVRDVYVKRRDHALFAVARMGQEERGRLLGATASTRTAGGVAVTAAVVAAAAAVGRSGSGGGGAGAGGSASSAAAAGDVIQQEAGEAAAAIATSSVKTDIAGPLCFAGDYLAKSVMLPRLEEGDVVFVLRTCV